MALADVGGHFSKPGESRLQPLQPFELHEVHPPGHKSKLLLSKTVNQSALRRNHPIADPVNSSSMRVRGPCRKGIFALVCPGTASSKSVIHLIALSRREIIKHCEHETLYLRSLKGFSMIDGQFLEFLAVATVFYLLVIVIR
jgi:hypothetical protein